MDKDIIAFVQNKKDNVATVLEDVEKGYIIYLKGGKRGNLIALEKIPKGHKIAISQIKKDELVIKYGESIGIATKTIMPGEYVHDHNIKSIKG